MAFVKDIGSLETILGIQCSRSDGSDTAQLTYRTDNSPVASSDSDCIDSLFASTISAVPNTALNESYLDSIFSAPTKQTQHDNNSATIWTNSKTNNGHHNPIDSTLSIDKQLQSDLTSRENNSAGPAQKAHMFTVQYSEKEKRERKYECEHCKKRFSRPSSLTSHVYTHTGERPFACDHPGCTKRFSVLSNLRRHYKVHNNRNLRRRSRGRGTPLAGTMFVGGDMSYPAGLAPNSMLLPAHISHARPPDNRAPAVYGWNAHMPTTPMPEFQRNLAYPSPVGYHAHHQLGYAPSFRTTAPMPSLQPQPNILDTVTGAAFSPGFQGLPLLSRPASSNIASPPCPAPILLSSINAATSNKLSPESQQSLCLTNAALPGNYGANITASHKATGRELSTAQLDALLGSATTTYSGDSDSSSSSDNAIASDSWPLSLGHTKLTFAGMVRSAGADSGTGTLTSLPSIATPAIFTNSSVTTKALNGGIESQTRGSRNADAFPSLTQPKQAMVGLAGMAQAPSNDTPTNRLLDSLGGNCADTRPDSTADSMWQLLQAECSQLL
ncbi:hypothetical protein GGH15_003505 [Coemansia sp. RSA 562]|nr:hypothetical protein GGH15_003505 [Coemansia sp. RSA 562]KAJ2195238.1 hypothetical protein IW144_003558 [Coemansia sp. RSA 522]